MVDKKQLLDFQEWRRVNPEGFSLFDYVHGKIAAGKVGPDLLIAVLSLLFPEFIDVDGMVFLEEQFSEKKLDNELRQGKSIKEIEYWMNILAITSLFEPMPDFFIQEIAAKMKTCWSFRLCENFPGKTFEVDLIKDDGELWISFYQVG